MFGVSCFLDFEQCLFLISCLTRMESLVDRLFSVVMNHISTIHRTVVLSDRYHCCTDDGLLPK